MKDKFDYIKSAVTELASIIDAPNKYIPTFGNSRDSHPNIEMSDSGQLSYEIFERGQEIKRDYPLDLDHLLYLVFRDITYQMAMEFASKRPKPNIDNRRVSFQHQLDLIGNLKNEWQQKVKQEQINIVMQFPFNDDEGKRDSYLRELMGNGFLYSEALEKVKKRFP